jgi:hypothetical protein
MKRFALVITSVLAMLIPASSSAADTTRWLDYPSCTATTTTLTCTGKAAGLQRPNNNPLGGIYPPEAAILGQVHYICSDPVFTTSWPGPRFDGAFATTAFHNGQTFTIEYSPPAMPPSITAAFACMFGTYTRDPNYYDVSVAIGFNYGSGSAVTVLEAPIGTVTAS